MSRDSTLILLVALAIPAALPPVNLNAQSSSDIQAFQKINHVIFMAQENRSSCHRPEP